MGYTPNNPCVYLKAAAGALAGLGASNKYLDAVNADYLAYARMADAYAQEFDTVWGAPAPTSFEEDAIFSASERVWSTRSALESAHAFTPGSYFGVVSGVIALVLEGNTQVVSEGIDPNSCSNGGSGGGKPFALFVDPQNSSGLASNNNDGQTVTTPILTTAENNDRIAKTEPTVAAPTTIQYMSEDLQALGANPVGIALGPMRINAALTIQMKPVVTRSTAGTFNAGTIAIDPSVAAGGQRQTGHVTDIADWAPFVFDMHGLGGASTVPQRILDLTTGASAWIADGAGSATASLSRPVDPTVSSSPAITIGDGYKIQRPGAIGLSNGPPPTLNKGGSVVFNDCAFSIGSVGPSDATAATLTPIVYNHCAFLGPLFEGGQFNDCYHCDGAQGGFFANIVAGAWLPNFNTDSTNGPLIFSSDTYVTGDSALNVGRGFYQLVEVLPGFGAGIQVQSISGSFPGVFYQQGACLALFGLLWGKNNATVGLAMGPGATLNVPSPGTPNITGASGDMWFELNAAAITHARAYDSTAGNYTETGGAATRTTTWAHLTATLAAGGFNGGMLCPEAMAAVVVNS